MNILIIGYGTIGKHIYKEFKQLEPDIYDPNIAKYAALQSKQYDFAFICVPTDLTINSGCDISIVERAVLDANADIIIIKSTVPPNTTNSLIVKSNKNIIFSPEHYGVTQHCNEEPGFVILGGDKLFTTEVAQLYHKVKNGYYKIYFTDSITAELSKYMLNSFLALKVTFCNEFADLANNLGVSYPELRELFIADKRVSASHTIVYPEQPYYNSHCFNKDIPALLYFANGYTPLILKMNEVNKNKKEQQ